MASRMVLFQDALGGYLTFPTLSEELRRATYPLFEFRQFVRHETTDVGLGQVHYFNRVGRLLTTVSPIGEQEQLTPMPVPTITRGQIIIKSYGGYVEYTETLERFAQFNVRQLLVDYLKMNIAYNLDLLVASTLKQTPVKAVPTSATGLTFYIAPTPPGVAGAEALRSAHIKDAVDYFRLDLQVPPYDGNNYVCIANGRAIRVLYDEITDSFLKYTSPDVFFQNEVAHWYGCRIIATNNHDALGRSVGSGSVKTSEAIFLAHDPIVEAVALPEELRFEPVANTFGRLYRLGWYFMGGWALTWETAGPGEARVIHLTSG